MSLKKCIKFAPVKCRCIGDLHQYIQKLLVGTLALNERMREYHVLTNICPVCTEEFTFCSHHPNWMTRAIFRHILETTAALVLLLSSINSYPFLQEFIGFFTWILCKRIPKHIVVLLLRNFKCDFLPLVNICRNISRCGERWLGILKSSASLVRFLRREILSPVNCITAVIL